MADINDVKVKILEMARNLILDIEAPSEIRGSGLLKVENYLEAYEKAYNRLCELTGIEVTEKVP
ncbi:MAG TPA: hypothetical protein ACFYD6_03250 [Candidatus Brocadiia bacterium]|nr:hypothetical protein [Planctomycetota bacterium]MDO8093492.1 hypothetical protein [Candidatus Brocadiales bacterium]